MGLYDQFKGYITNLVGAKTSANIVKATNTALTVLTKPIQSITGRFDQAYNKTMTDSPLSLVSQSAFNTLAVLTPFTAPVKSLIVKAVTTSSPLTKLGVITAGTIAIPAVVSNPKLLSYLPEPSNLPSVGAEFGSFTADPTYAKALQIVKDHPYLDALAIITLVGVTGKAASLLTQAYTSYKLSKVTNDIQDKGSIEDKTPNKTQYVSDGTNDLGTGQTINIYNQVPTTPTPIIAPVSEETKPTTKKKTTAKKKTTKKKTTAKKKTTKKYKSRNKVNGKYVYKY